jgi:uncharacterized Zn-binding protein involved in type VI secretion
MSNAARVTDATGHGQPLGPGPGSSDVTIGSMPAWRALPEALGAAVAAASNAVDAFMQRSTMKPAKATADLARMNAKFGKLAGKAATAGAPGAPDVCTTQLGTLNTTNGTLTATWTTASAAPGGQPAADEAYTKAIKAAVGAAASAMFSALASITDMHICPMLAGTVPHGPGFVTAGSRAVFINELPAVRQNDKVMEACGGAAPISIGCPTVEIG